MAISQHPTFATKAEAQRWARPTESEMDRGVFCSMVEAETTTLGELLERYELEVIPNLRSRDTLKSDIKTLDQAMGHLVLAAITPVVVKEFREWRLEQVSSETARKSLQLLSRVLKVDTVGGAAPSGPNFIIVQ